MVNQEYLTKLINVCYNATANSIVGKPIKPTLNGKFLTDAEFEEIKSKGGEVSVTYGLDTVAYNTLMYLISHTCPKAAMDVDMNMKEDNGLR